jgi:hypothetical protein
MSISSGSVKSIESMYSDECPVSPSLLYEQRAMLYETREKQRHRKALTAYRSYKSRLSIGGASTCLRHEERMAGQIIEKLARTGFPRSRTYRLRDKVSNLEMISTGM